MILRWIYEKLIQKRDKERHQVVKLEWQKATLEQEIRKIKDCNLNNK